MRSKQFDRLFGRSHLQGDAHSGMAALELHDDLGQQICAGKRRRHDRHRTEVAAAELGYAEACSHQQGLGPQNVVGDEITSHRELAVPPCPLHEFESQCVLQLGDMF